MERERLQVVLRSTKVARIEEYQSGTLSTNSLMAWNGQLLATRRRIVVYDYVFDEKQKKALREARELAMRTGLVLQVTDLTRQSALERVLRSGLARLGAGIRGQPTRGRLDVRPGPMRSQACPP